MKNKIDYKALGLAIMLTPKAFLLLLFAVATMIWVPYRYWKEEQQSWTETQANLTDIQLNERQRSNTRELFLKLTFDYTVANVKYQAFLEEIVLNEFQAASRTKELTEANEVATVYYQDDNPAEVTFDVQEIKADRSLLYVLIPSMMLIAALGYWGLRLNYSNYVKSKNY